MKRILLTGMSGTGKSTLIGELAGRGYKALDLDCPEYSQWVSVDGDDGLPGTPVEPDRDWVWREDRVQELLDTEDTGVLFLSGCASNLRKFLCRLDLVIHLTAPNEVIAERLRTRENNRYGKRPQELARVFALRESVEPLLRRVAGCVIDTSEPLPVVLARLLRLAGESGS